MFRFIAIELARGSLVFAIALSLPAPFYAVRSGRCCAVQGCPETDFLATLMGAGIENIIASMLKHPPKVTPRWRIIVVAAVTIGCFVVTAVFVPQITTVFRLSSTG